MSQASSAHSQADGPTLRLVREGDPLTPPPGLDPNATLPSGLALDEALRRAGTGDEAAWVQIINAYSRRVFGLLLKRCGDRELSEELTQATFVKVVGNLGKKEGYEEQGKFKAWLFRIAMNNLRDEMRRRGRQAIVVDMSPAAGAGSTGGDDRGSAWAAAEAGGVQLGPTPPESPFDVVERGEQIDLLRAAILKLPDKDQELLHLRHTAGMTFPEISETLNEPLGTVLARGHRAVAKLRKMLVPEDGE